MRPRGEQVAGPAPVPSQQAMQFVLGCQSPEQC